MRDVDSTTDEEEFEKVSSTDLDSLGSGDEDEDAEALCNEVAQLSGPNASTQELREVRHLFSSFKPYYLIYVIQQALKAVQLENGALRKKVRELKRKNAVFLASQPKRARNVMPTNPEIAQYRDEVSRLGKKFGVMHELFITETEFNVPCPAMKPDDPERYKNQGTMRDGIIAEVFAFVPSRLHALMENHHWFGATVCRFIHTSILLDL